MSAPPFTRKVSKKALGFSQGSENPLGLTPQSESAWSQQSLSISYICSFFEAGGYILLVGSRIYFVRRLG
jgi:hypothetical protein